MNLQYNNEQETQIKKYNKMKNSPEVNKASTGPMGFGEDASQPYYTSRQFNTGSITVWVAEDLFYIEPKYANTFIPTVIKIDRKSQLIWEMDADEFKVDKIKEELRRREKKLDDEQKYSKMEAMHFSFLIGVINLADIGGNGEQEDSKNKGKGKRDKKILLFAETVQLVCTINQRNIYKILKPVYIFYNPKDKESLNEEQAIILLNVSLIFQKGMYYSYTYNLAIPLKDEERGSEPQLIREMGKKTSRQSKQSDPESQGKYKVEKKTSLDSTSHDKQKDREAKHNSFNWAYFLHKELKSLNDKWRMPVIQGFVGKMEVYVNAHKFKISLISRRSKRNGGPFQYCTGFTQLPVEGKPVDSHKSTANFVQTELIFHVKKLYFSFIQIRGTVPLHWQHRYNYGIISGVKFTRTIEQNYQDFMRHIKRIKKSHDYSYVTILNLLQKESPNIEAKMIQNLQYIVKKSEKEPGLRYKYFDLKQRCPGKDYRQFNKYINNQLKTVLLSCSFSVLQRNSTTCLQKIHVQKGIVRINCATCIDRSNIVQSRIAAWQMVHMLRTLNVKITNMDQSLDFVQSDTPFARLYRNMWADNGDAISEQYSGTTSMESTAVRMGKLSYLSTIDHGLTSLYRIVRKLRDEDNGKYKAVLFLSRPCSPDEQNENEPTVHSHSNEQLTS